MVNLVFKDIKLILRSGSVIRTQVLDVKHLYTTVFFLCNYEYAEQAKTPEILGYLTPIKISRNHVPRC